MEKKKSKKLIGSYMYLLHPTYFPSIASFSVMANNPIEWEVMDNYQKQTFRNRAYICTDRGKHLLSIPILHVGTSTGRQLYKEVRLDNTYPWQRQHWRTLETAYRTSPFFEFYEDDIKPLYFNPFELLMDFNFHTIKTICSLLPMKMPDRTTTLYEITPQHGMDMRYLVNAKKNSNFVNQPYVQVFGDKHGFIPNLSILDLLFNLGPEGLSYLKKEEVKLGND